MPREVIPRTSRGAEPDEHPPKYGLRKRTARGTVSNGKNLEDDDHQTLAKRTKRTATNTRAQSSFSKGSVKKRRKVSWRQGWAQKNKNREWLAEAILEENATQYLIEYEPVSEGAQREISWQPKHYANAALVNDWEERKMATAHGNNNAEPVNDSRLTSGGDEASQRCSSVNEPLGQSTTDNRDDVHLEVVPSTFQPKSSKPAPPTSNKLEMSASSRLLRIADDENSAHALLARDTEAVKPSLVDNATTCVSRTRVDRMSVQAPSGLQIKNHSLAEGLEQVTESHVTRMGSQGVQSPRPGTKISTLLSPAPRTLSNNNNNNNNNNSKTDYTNATSAGKESGEMLSSTSAYAEVFKKASKHGVSDVPQGRLASAKNQLRSLLRGSGRRRY